MPTSVISTTDTSLTTATTKIQKTRYFSIEMKCVNMQPNTKYDFYVDGILMNAFVKPFGGNLGDALISGNDGKLIAQFHMQIPFNQKYLTTKVDVSGYMTQQKVLEFRDPNGVSSVSYLPVGVKVTG